MPRIVVLLLSSCVVVSACERRASAPSLADVRAAEGPEQESWGVHTYVTQVPLASEESRLRIEMIADYMAWVDQQDSTYQLLTGDPQGNGNRVLIYLYDDLGDSLATVTADRVMYFDRANRFEAQGGVVVETSEGKRLESEFLQWREDERKIRTESYVRIVSPDESVQGFGLVADEDLASYQIGRFTALVNVPQAEGK